jgi:hypothetical protein
VAKKTDDGRGKKNLDGEEGPLFPDVRTEPMFDERHSLKTHDGILANLEDTLEKFDKAEINGEESTDRLKILAQARLTIEGARRMKPLANPGTGAVPAADGAPAPKRGGKVSDGPFAIHNGGRNST